MRFLICILPKILQIKDISFAIRQIYNQSHLENSGSTCLSIGNCHASYRAMIRSRMYVKVTMDDKCLQIMPCILHGKNVNLLSLPSHLKQ